MAAINSGLWQKALWPGVSEWFNDGYGSLESEYPQFFTTKASSKAFEQAVGQSLLGLAIVKDQGESIQYDDAQQTYINNWVHTVYALGVMITQEAYRDNQYNLDALSRKPRALGRSMKETKDHVASLTLNRGFSGTYTMGAGSDGKGLFDSAHPSGPYGATRSNLLTAADLAETTLEDALVSIMNATDPRGLKINIMPSQLVIPPAQNFLAARILESTLQNDTANNAVNVLKTHNSLPKGYAINHYLTDTDAWFVTTSVNAAGDGLVCYDAWGVEYGQDGDFDTMNMRVRASERYSFGWADFLGVFGNAGA